MRPYPDHQVFEYRSADEHHLSPRMAKVLRAFNVAVLVGLVAVFAWATFASNPTIESAIYHSPLLLLLALANSRQWTHYRLEIENDVLRFARQLPFGLNRFFPNTWRVELRDVAAIECRQIDFGLRNTGLGTIQLILRPRHGPERRLVPADWFLPGSPARPRPPGPKFEWPGVSSRHDAMAQRLAYLQTAFDEFPLISALRARGLEVPKPTRLNTRLDADLFASRSIKFAMCTGLGLFIAALLLMLLRQNQHLQSDFSVAVYVTLNLLALGGFASMIVREQKKPPLGHSILGGIILAAGISFSAQILAVALNGLGVPTTAAQSFVVRQSVLEPTDPVSGIGKIDLPGPQSRMSALSEGTRVTLEVTNGRLGLWEYNDLPLRALADQQGIR